MSPCLKDGFSTPAPLQRAQSTLCLQADAEFWRELVFLKGFPLDHYPESVRVGNHHITAVQGLFLDDVREAVSVMRTDQETLSSLQLQRAPKHAKTTGRPYTFVTPCVFLCFVRVCLLFYKPQVCSTSRLAVGQLRSSGADSSHQGEVDTEVIPSPPLFESTSNPS